MYEEYLPPKAGVSAAELRLKAQNARMVLSSSPPTPGEAIEAAHALTSHWNPDLPDERLDSIAAVFMRFPRGVIAACVSLDGIANTKIKDLRTGKLETRRFVPSTPEIREWCNDYLADQHEIAKAGEIACRPIASPPLSPARRTPTAEEAAHVSRVVDQIRERCNRVLGIPTAEEQRQLAERILEACREQT
jgi:hypothetical protein